MAIDPIKQRREFLRWVMLLGLYNAAPVGAWEEVLLSIAQGVYADSSQHEVRLVLDYLSDRELIKLEKKPDGRWFCDLTRHGTDVVEYTVCVDPGIARPPKL